MLFLFIITGMISTSVKDLLMILNDTNTDAIAMPTQLSHLVSYWGTSCKYAWDVRISFTEALLMRFSWEEQGWAEDPLMRSIRNMMYLGGHSPGDVQKVPLGRHDLMQKSTSWGTEQGLIRGLTCPLVHKMCEWTRWP